MDGTDKNTLVNNAGARSKWAAPLFLIALAGIILGVFPHSQVFWAKCWIAEWSILIFIALVFLKDKWLKVFLIICLINFIRTFNLGGGYKGIAFVAFYYIFLFLMVYQILLNKIRGKDIKLIINGICVIFLIQLFYMYLQYFGIDPIFQLRGFPARTTGWLSTNTITTATWGNTNISGASLAITLPLFFRKKWWIAILPIVLMIGLNGSLGSVIAGGVGIFFYLTFAKNLFISRWTLLFVAFLAVFFYSTLVAPHKFNLNNARMSLLKPAIKIIKQHPIIGYGLGQYKIAFQQISRHIFKIKQRPTHAHFDFVEVVIDLGWIGGVVILGFLINLLCHFFRNMTPLSLAAMSGVVVGLVNSCSTFVFHTPLAWIILILMVVVKKGGANVNQIHRI